MTTTVTVGLLICTLISENQGLKKSRSATNLRKIPANLDFFFSLTPGCFSDLQYKTRFFFRWRPRKKNQVCRPEFFLRFETDFDFSRP